jgi:hypothetical protein
MLSKTINSIRVVFNPGEADTAEVIGKAITKTLFLIQESWGLSSPPDCRIYVMTSIWRFTYQSAPWLWRIMLAGTFPLWAFRLRRIWPYAGGLTQRYGRRVVIGVKPPRLLEVSDKSFGLQMYVPETDPKKRIQHFTCHELTHACAAHLKLPAWLNEGIAMFTVDRYMGKATIRTDTLEFLQRPAPLERPPGYAQLTRMKADVVVYYTLLGYWLVHYLEEVSPDFLKSLFSSKSTSRSIEGEIARILSLDPLDIWHNIPDLITGFYGARLTSSAGD